MRQVIVPIILIVLYFVLPHKSDALGAWFVPAVIAGLGALGGIFGNRDKTIKQQQQTNQQQSQQQNQQYANTSYILPEYDALTGGLRGNLANMYLQRAQSVPDFMRNYQAQGLENINQSSDALRSNLSSILASRGLSYSPAAATAETGLEGGRISQQLGFQNQLPLVQDQLQQQRLGDLSNFFARLPVGQTGGAAGTSLGDFTGTSSGTSTGTTSIPGNMLGGGFGGISSILAYLYGKGGFGGFGGGGGG